MTDNGREFCPYCHIPSPGDLNNFLDILQGTRSTKKGAPRRERLTVQGQYYINVLFYLIIYLRRYSTST